MVFCIFSLRNILLTDAFLFTDGGSRNNPGPAAAGFVIRDRDGKLLKKYGKYLGRATNNEAEYQALILGLREVASRGFKQVRCFLDSSLAVNQLNGVFKIKEARLRELVFKVKALERKFAAVSYEHVPREQNREADELVNKALNERGF